MGELRGAQFGAQRVCRPGRSEVPSGPSRTSILGDVAQRADGGRCLLATRPCRRRIHPPALGAFPARARRGDYQAASRSERKREVTGARCGQRSSPAWPTLTSCCPTAALLVFLVPPAPAAAAGERWRAAAV